MPENKTRPTGVSVKKFIASRANEQQRADCRELLALLKKVSFCARGASPELPNRRRCARS
jgi:hypothetical protein